MSATGTIYGYCRISTEKQNLERQIDNIQAVYPTAKIYKEIFTGRKTTGRKELEKILKRVKKGDTIVFDSVSRMSRNAEEGFKLYMELFNSNVDLVFLKEPYINTSVFRKASTGQVSMTGEKKVDAILKGVNECLMLIAEEQIQIAFNQSEKEVSDLRERTKEGLRTAKKNGKVLGRAKGTKIDTKQGDRAKKAILKYSKAFGGELKDVEVMRIANVSKATYHRYKKQLLQTQGQATTENTESTQKD